jgi:FlaA1/EpsC-like NDP-sugar epimerase
VIVADVSEFNLYQVEDRLRNYRAKLELCLMDAKYRSRFAALLAKYRPQIVFHAAAYKHVHLVEQNPVEGVINNLASMKNGADLAHEFGCEQFIFISSDKAVRPAGVMGATKRIGELYVQSLNSQSECSFFAVRFGNVFGSSGSLVPNIIKRIRQGEPVQITHPDMTRYFMLLPEAVSLILQACLHAKGGEVFILDMGNPVKVVDLVKDLILLLGRQPEIDVPIEFIGPRPGEKLHEELFADGLEHRQQMDGFFVSTSPVLDFDQMCRLLEDILEPDWEGQVDDLLALIRHTVSSQARLSL